jgi:DNA-binding NarL/FixJ family response regulator
MDTIRALLADDHAVVRAGIKNELKDLPEFEIVAEASDGPALMSALEQTRPDFLILDISMPEFDPIASLRQMRAAYPQMKILVISAHDDDVYVQGLLGAGVDGYHLKDQSMDELRMAVQQIQNGKKWISSRLLDKLIAPMESPAFGISTLTSRQRDILHLLQQGFDNQSIARRLGLSVKTIEKHLTSFYRQIGVQSRLEAVHYVAQHPEVLTSSGQRGSSARTDSRCSNKPISILLVDDNIRYRHQLRRMVGRVCPQAAIYEAETLEEALSTTQRVPLHLALVDVVLGEENGIRCTRRLKALSPQLRVILISAYPDREFHRQGLEAGAIAFLDKKDLDVEALQQVIDDSIA